MSHEALIAKLRNRATAYSPQQQMETMNEAAAVIETYDETAARAILGTMRKECRRCEYYDDSGELSAKPICSHSHGMDEPQPTDYCSRYTPWEDAAAPPDDVAQASPQDTIQALGICSELFNDCAHCAFGPPDDDFHCRNALMLAADELIRAKYGE